MPEFIKENIGTIVVGLILLVIIVFVIVRMWKNKKNNKSICGCGCSGCPKSESCGKR